MWTVKKSTRISIGIAAVILATTASAAEPLAMTLEPVFQGFTPSYSATPVVVRVSNDGPDAEGELRIRSDTFDMVYPVSVPRGGVQRLVAYPTLEYSGLRLTLRTNRGSLRQHIPPGFPPTAQGEVVLMISDAFGELAFLRTMSAQPAQLRGAGFSDAYCRPEMAPDRPVGYEGVSTIFLGHGAERLSDAQIQALRSWTVTGGSLIFVGGDRTAVLSDPRWDRVRPAKGFRARTLAKSEVLSQVGGWIEPGKVTLLDGTPAAGSTVLRNGKVLVSAEKPVGMGRAVYLAFDPFSKQLIGWPGRGSALRRVARLGMIHRGGALLATYGQISTLEYPMAPATAVDPPGSATAAPFVPQAPVAPSADDPFSATLPPTERIFQVLGAYFIVVIPLNFLLLKRLKRGELAWVTAPLISLAFAGILFTSAQALYSAKTSTSTSGLLVAQEGIPEAMFIGTSQIFIPESGGYDLGLKDVDGFGFDDSINYGAYGPRRNDNMELGASDHGTVEVKRMRAKNLTFREMTYRQKFEAGGWFDFKVLKSTSQSVRVQVKNNGPYAVTQGYISAGHSLTKLPRALAPGDAATVEIPMRTIRFKGGDWTTADPRIVTGPTKGLALLGQLKGLRPGPQVGANIAERTSVTMLAFADEVLQ